MSEHTKGPLVVGFYHPSERFLAVREHVAVMKPTGELVAVTGSNDNAETPSSLADARLFCAANELLEASQTLVSVFDAPDFDTPDLVRAVNVARAAITQARGGK